MRMTNYFDAVLVARARLTTLQMMREVLDALIGEAEADLRDYEDLDAEDYAALMEERRGKIEQSTTVVNELLAMTPDERKARIREAHELAERLAKEGGSL